MRQERFCEFIVSGMSGVDAWLQVYPKVSRNTARANAAESLAKPSVAAHVAELRKPQTKKCLLTKDRKRELLMEKIESTTFKPADWLRAIEIDARLAGHFEPERVEVETGPRTLDEIRARANAVASGLDLIARRSTRAAEMATASHGGNGSNGGNGAHGGNGNGKGNGHHPPTKGLTRWTPSE